MDVIAILLLTSQVVSIGVILYLIRSAEHTKKLLKDRVKMREDFMDMTVHELRSPLTAIKDASSMLVTLTTLDANERAKLLHIIHDQSKFMLDQVTVLLDFAKLNQGKLTIQKISCDLIELLQQEVQIFLPQAQKRNMNITTEFDPNLPAFCFDKMRIAQVMNNIISNSIKYGRDNGHIILRAKAAEQHGDQVIVVSVTDDGPGIPKERQESLFDKFSQLDNGKYNNLSNSSGLGLYVAKGIIEEHGGKITLESEPGHGTTVSFTLPLVLTMTPTPDTTHQVAHATPVVPS
jgi:signal transduction histidine kinase